MLATGEAWGRGAVQWLRVSGKEEQKKLLFLSQPRTGTRPIAKCEAVARRPVFSFQLHPLSSPARSQAAAQLSCPKVAAGGSLCPLLL